MAEKLQEVDIQIFCDKKKTMNTVKVPATYSRNNGGATEVKR